MKYSSVFTITVTMSVLWLGPWTSHVQGDEPLESADQRYATADISETPDFQRHVVPLLSRLGCNGRSCHGSFQGRGGMQLSLFGYDFEMDYAALVAEAESSEGRRVDWEDADNSLMLLKALMQVEHGGGQRFDGEGWEHRLLRRWIQTGEKKVVKPRELSHLEVAPAEIVFQSKSSPISLRVVAVWKEGTREDVTPLCRFRTNDDSIATVDKDGLVRSTGPGDTNVIAFYDNGIVAVPILRPLCDGVKRELTRESDGEAGIDVFVNAKLAKLGITPSDRCTDSEFLRRVSINLTGTSPTPAEITDFLADSSSNKRERKVDQLLKRPAYAAWWANKICDFTGCNPNQQVELGQEISVQWYTWVYQRLRENLPYDEIVQRIVLANGRKPSQSYEQYAEQTSAFFRDENPTNFSRRATMPHYWTRHSMRESEQAAQAFAQNFLGIRMQCAQCHKHPFAPWTQNDFTEFARFFEPIQFGVQPDAQDAYQRLAKQVGLSLRGPNSGAIRSETLRQARKGRTIPWRELFVEEREQPETISLLRSGSVTLREQDDPREPIMQWMSDPENPYFARAIVNRVWAGYFHVGIVNPTDDLTPANPPSHPKLLQWLVDRFIASGYDLKWLHRQIVLSQTYQRSWLPNDSNRQDDRNFSRAIPRRIPAEVVYDIIKQALVSDDRLSEVRTDLTRRAIGHLSMRLAGTHAMRVFGKPDRMVNCDCERVNQPTLLQAMYLQNDPLVEQQLQSSGWIQQIQSRGADPSLEEKEKLVREAWLRTVNRPPSDHEQDRAMLHLANAESLDEAMSDLLWSLMNTKEFILLK